MQNGKHHGPGAAELAKDWETSPRWEGIKRPYSADDVVRLRGSLAVEHTLANVGSRKLWDLLDQGGDSYVNALGALTGNQAMQQVRAGLKAIYLSGWQVAADANLAGEMYPDQSLYPSNSAAKVVDRINRTLLRADQIAHSEGDHSVDWLAPIVADAESGFGGPLNAFELTRSMIEAGVSGIHFEDQLASAKKCGHMGGKVLVPTREAVSRLVAARFAADLAGVPMVLIARTDAEAAKLVTSDIDPADQPHIDQDAPRTSEGFFQVRNGLPSAISRALSYAPYADVIWCETAVPDLKAAKEFAGAVHEKFPGKKLAYNCSPSFNWKKNLDDREIAIFQDELGKLGYRFQFVTLAGFHALNHSMFDLSRNYRDSGMPAFVSLQEREFAAMKDGFTAVRHQHEVGAGYYDQITMLVSNGDSALGALGGSTEEEQFGSAPAGSASASAS